MAEFTPITSQEELEKVIGSRLKRERDAVAKEYEDRLAENSAKLKECEGQIASLSGELKKASGKNKEYDAQVSELTGKIKGYETSALKTRVAHEAGLPYEMAGRLSGEDEDAIRKDADTLKKIIRSNRPSAQHKSNEPEGIDEKRVAMQQVVRNLNGKGE